LARVAERPALYVVGGAGAEAVGGEASADADASAGDQTPGAVRAEHADMSADDADGAQPGFAAPTTLEQARAAVVVTLYGPQEVMGAPTQYGERLARLCRALLGYRRALAPQGAALGGGEGLRGAARVYLYGRPMTFPLDDRLLRLLRVGATEAADDLAGAIGPAGSSASPADTAVAFDSSLERRLYADFTALERAGETAGWRMEREPEPLLIGGAILVPDFALTRGLRRVYLEIAGYWRPGYRERKARKLAALRGAAALVVAAPTSARAEFAGLDDAFPFLWYRDNGTINAALLITLIERAYDDFPTRLATLDLPRIRAEVVLRGRIPPTESMALLHCYTRDELAVATRRLSARDRRNADAFDGARNGKATSAQVATMDGDDADTDIAWLDGVGLCSRPWRVAVTARLLALLRAAPDGQLPLADLRDALNAGDAPSDWDAADEVRSGKGVGVAGATHDRAASGAFTDEATETVAGLAGARVSRASLFAVIVGLPESEQGAVGAGRLGSADTSSAAPAAPPTNQPVPPASGAMPRPAGRRAQPRQGARRKEHDGPAVNPTSSAFIQQTFFPTARADAADPERPDHQG